MLSTLLLFSTSCTVLAELPDRSEGNPSCLLQINRQIPTSAATVNEHLSEADHAHVSSQVQQSLIFGQMSETAGKPWGRGDMQETTMSQEHLPEGSRHLHRDTYVSDWSREYHPFVRSTKPTLPTQPAELDMYWAYWLFLLAFTCCLVMVCCCLAISFCRRQKRETDAFSSRQISSAPICVLPNHPFFHAYQRECMLARRPPSPQHYAKMRPHHVSVLSHDELNLEQQAFPPGHHALLHTETSPFATSQHPSALGSHGYRPEGAPPPTSPGRPVSSNVATAGVDSNGDGRVDYLYTGTDYNNDGIPDALQTPLPYEQSPFATVALDAHGVDKHTSRSPDLLPRLHEEQGGSSVAFSSTSVWQRPP